MPIIALQNIHLNLRVAPQNCTEIFILSTQIWVYYQYGPDINTFNAKSQLYMILKVISVQFRMKEN